MYSGLLTIEQSFWRSFPSTLLFSRVPSLLFQQVYGAPLQERYWYHPWAGTSFSCLVSSSSTGWTRGSYSGSYSSWYLPPAFALPSLFWSWGFLLQNPKINVSSQREKGEWEFEDSQYPNYLSKLRVNVPVSQHIGVLRLFPVTMKSYSPCKSWGWMIPPVKDSCMRCLRLNYFKETTKKGEENNSQLWFKKRKNISLWREAKDGTGFFLAVPLTCQEVSTCSSSGRLLPGTRNSVAASQNPHRYFDPTCHKRILWTRV